MGGQTPSALKDPIYRSAQCRQSTYLLGLKQGKRRAPVDRGNAPSGKRYRATEDQAKWGWIHLRDSLRSGGYVGFAYEFSNVIGSQFPER